MTPNDRPEELQDMNMINMLQLPSIKPSLNKIDKINYLKDTIIFLQGVKNAGVFFPADTDFPSRYEPFLKKGPYSDLLETNIIDLSELLVKQTKALFK